ncbi:hypothetical protein F0U44_21555 [Nocardioides humilatus]|uniref:Uncharacterized protein n=1 Tax=Nocardioides humilatus TaxID=2607660 RepID=A0A5B1L3H8_9ACTN|nr:hypothetical protein [Nocardioides humilatus]KAA1415281.1 hypothetical protein F0U44_21555 [Nocardioides humilatus]
MAASRTFGAVALAAALPVALLVPDGTAAPAADPTPVVLTATLELHGEGGSNDVTVSVEPGLGRIEVSPYYWFAPDAGRYVHVALGTSDGGACQVARRIVVDTDDLTAASAYDAAGDPLPETEQFTVSDDWSELVARIGIAPFDPVDCARAISYDSPDPVDHGPRIWRGGVVLLSETGYADIPSTFPIAISCPRWIPWASEAGIGVTLLSDPGSYPGAGVIPHPSHLDSAEVTLDPGPFTVTSMPDLPADLDLWTAPPNPGDLAIDPADDQFLTIRIGGTVVRDGAAVDWTCGRVPVSVPAPTGWVGSLEGTLWWKRDTDFNGGIGTYGVHRTYEFLDDTWVYVDDEYDGPHTEPCTEVDHDWPDGCHRYFYDDETGRLQIDDRRASYANGGYQLPGFSGSYAQYRDYQVVEPARSDQRFAYRGKSRSGSLVLRRDGTYHYEGLHPEGDGEVDWSGRYRFVGDDDQEIVLRHGRRAFRDEVQLYFWNFDGRDTLRDLDTHHRVFRFRAAG